MDKWDKIMSQEYFGMIVIIVACALVLLIGFLRNRAMWIVNCILRMVFGAITIYLCNAWLSERHMLGRVGLNEISLLTAAFLGIPGVAALYGIRFFMAL